MQVTLRKASALSEAARDLAKALSANNAVTLSVYQTQTVEESIAAQNTNFQAEIGNAQDLLLTSFGLRKTIAEANVKAGVNDILTDIAYLNAYENILSRFKNSTPSNVEVVKRQFAALNDRIAQPAQGLYGRHDTEIKVDALDSEVVENIKQQLFNITRKKNELNEKLLGINLTTKIDLSSDAVTILTRNNLI